MKQRADMLDARLSDVLRNRQSDDATIVDQFFQTPAMCVLQISTGSQTKQRACRVPGPAWQEPCRRQRLELARCDLRHAARARRVVEWA
jgi:hypothetical protein